MRNHTFPPIFSEKVFGRNALFSEITTGKEPIPEEEPHMEDDDDGVSGKGVSVFDYLLGQKFGIIPFRNNDCVYFDWLGYQTVGSLTLNAFCDKYGAGCIQDICDDAVVHEGCFYEFGDIDLTRVFAALFISPEPYSVCCMQWDAYMKLFTFAYDTRNTPISEYASCTMEGIRRMTTDIHKWLRIRRVYCDREACGVVNPSEAHTQNQDYLSCRDIMQENVQWTLCGPANFTSNFGLRDLYQHSVTNTGQYAGSCISIESPDVVLALPAAIPDLRIGPSFFSDVYG